MENLDGRRSIREYLLGILEDQSIKSQIEEKLLADDGEISTAEDELIEQYLDDELSPADRKHFINHFLAAPQRKQQFRVHQNLRKYAASQEPARAVSEAPSHKGWRRFFLIPALSYALVFVVVLGGGYGILLLTKTYPPGVETTVADLYKGDRPFDSRIVDLDYALPSTQRGDKDPAKDPNRDLKRRAALLLLEKAVRDKRTAESLYDLGKAYLAEGNLPDATRYFEEAATLGPVSARLMSDLGTAYFEAWKKDRASAKPEMLDKSLQSLERAIELDPRLLEPRFNRPLVLEAKGSREQAKQAWREYLQLDPNSKWAEEAARNLQHLEEQ
jgi:tetratricopeptide (TPR) repeat protein